MAKVTVRVDTHRHQPEKFVGLMKKIVERHEAMGASSPLNDISIVDMAAFKAKLIEADTLREESIEARATAEIKMNEAKEILGTGAGQTTNTKGTLYYDLCSIKRQLLNRYRETPESASHFGFNVVIDTAKGIGRPKKKKKQAVKASGLKMS